MKKVPLTIGFDSTKVIGHFQVVNIPDNMLKDMVFAPAYRIDAEGNIEITEFSLIKGENYNLKP